MSRILLIFLLLLSGNVFAGRVEKYIGEAERYNNDTTKNMSEDQLRKVLEDYGKTPEEASYSEKELRAKAEAMIRESKSKANDTSLPPRKRAEAQAAAGVSESYARTNKFHNIDSEKTFKRSFLISESSLDGAKSECSVSGEFDEKTDLKPESYEVEVDDVREIEFEQTCEEDESAFHKCESALKLTCQKSSECDSGGIILKGLASDMQWAYQYPVLTLGTIADNYWRSGCGKFARNTAFEVKNKAVVDEFRIIRVGFDDYLRVSINGIQIYNEPYGGDLLAIERGRVAKNSQQIEDIRSRRGLFASGGYPCELSRSNNIAVNIDLLPYLKEGMNELNIEVVVAGAGEGWIQIRTKQHCCDKWVETWEESCGQNS